MSLTSSPQRPVFLTEPSEEVVFTCSGGHRFTALEAEMGMTQGTMDFLMEQQEREYNYAADTAREEELARMYALGQLECPWPWYADEPVVEVESEIIYPDVAICALYAETAKAYWPGGAVGR